MISKIKTLSSVFAFMLLLTVAAFGQETTGNIEVTVSDPSSARVPGASIVITGGSVNRTVTADEQGFARIQQLQPGMYTVAVSGGNFRAVNFENVEVVLGKTTPINAQMQAGGIMEAVEVSASDVAPIDPTDNTIQTNITERTAELLPKGVNFTSLLQTAPAVRNEPLSGGFQIDGASGSENTFIIDGQEVSNFRTGTLNTNNNIPFQFVQEVSIKSSGFDAEFGGATGGVVSVATRGGSNEWRGEFGMEFRPGGLQGTPRSFLRLTTVPANTTTGVTALTTQEYIPVRKDGGTDVFPTASLGGPIIKNRAWFFGSYSPHFLHTDRTVQYFTNDPRTRTVRDQQTYTSRQRNEYTFARIDLQPFNTLRMTGTYLWNPIDLRGILPLTTTLFDTTLPGVTFPGRGRVAGSEYINNTGGRQSSNNTTGSIIWTPNEKLVLTARGGYSFLNEKLGNYGIPGVTGQTRHIVQATTTAPPADFGLGVGQTFPSFTQILFDASRRRTFDADASYIVNNFGGRHQFKGGVQFNGISNQIQSTLVDTVVLRFGTDQTVESLSGHEFPRSPTSIGAGWLQRFGAQGAAGSNNLAFYIQDSWQPTDRLTLNLGLRTERENSPSFNELGEGITFDFMDKLAPRLGFAYDLTGDGKTKLFGSYGQFYDRFKYELPRGSFGGNFFRNDYFEIFPGQTVNSFNRQTIIGGNGDPIGGTCPIANSQGFSRCQLDFRIPSNLPGQPEFGQVDPDIKAFRQSEFTIGLERDLGMYGLLFRGRYTHKQVDVAVEDIGIVVPGGEAYIIGNPGRGLAKEISEANGVLAIEAVRDYDAVELNIDKRFTDRFYFNSSYTWSRLFGNYAGLASSDEPTATAASATSALGRTSPNVNRNFDLPFIGFSALGKPDNGLLATDRPHSFKFSGAYEQRWNSTNSTEISGFQIIQSGTPITTRFTFHGVAGQILNGRGDLGRTEAFTQTDLGLRHRYRFGNDGRFAFVANIDLLNLFDESNVLAHFETISATGVDTNDIGLPTNNPGFLLYQTTNTSTAFNKVLEATRDPRYNLPNLFQGPRSVRFGFKLQF